jgi:cell wall-associated NlpC family hydrolase
MGIALPRDAWQQATFGTVVPLGQHRRGDLAFFANAEGRITHTGILLGQYAIVHAHGYVRQDDFKDAGILNSESGRVTHTLSHVMRIT